MDLVSNEVRTFFGTKKFKGFQGHIPHFSMTPFSAKKSLDSMSFLGDVSWRWRAQIKQLAWPLTNDRAAN